MDSFTDEELKTIRTACFYQSEELSNARRLPLVDVVALEKESSSLVAIGLRINTELKTRMTS